MILLLSQKNEIYDLIVESGFSPSQFEFKEFYSKFSINQKIHQLNLKNSEYFFSFETAPKTTTKHFAIFSPGENSYIEKRPTESWGFQIRYFKYWLNFLHREINEPNKWERLAQEINGIKMKFNDNDSHTFTVNEYEDLKQRMYLLKQKISVLGLNPDDELTINQKLDYLTELGKEMNKFDWKGLFVGSIIGIIIQLEVTPENANTLWRLIREVFNNYLLT